MKMLRRSSITAGITVFLLSMTLPAHATADPEPVAAPAEDSTGEVQEFTTLSSLGIEETTTIRPAVPSDFPAHPAPGQVVITETPEGLTVMSVGVSASCQTSFWANTPTKTGNAAYGRFGMSLGAGCADRQFVGHMEKPGPLGGFFRQATSIGPMISAGQSASSSVRVPCRTGDRTDWRLGVYNPPSGVGAASTLSEVARLDCNN